jgi:hypothetical protein
MFLIWTILYIAAHVEVAECAAHGEPFPEVSASHNSRLLAAWECRARFAGLRCWPRSYCTCDE